MLSIQVVMELGLSIEEVVKLGLPIKEVVELGLSMEEVVELGLSTEEVEELELSLFLGKLGCTLEDVQQESIEEGVVTLLGSGRANAKLLGWSVEHVKSLQVWEVLEALDISLFIGGNVELSWSVGAKAMLLLSVETTKLLQ